MSSSMSSTWLSRNTRLFRRLQASIVAGRFFAMVKPRSLPANDQAHLPGPQEKPLKHETQ
jgi:hypothetical protein